MGSRRKRRNGGAGRNSKGREGVVLLECLGGSANDVEVRWGKANQHFLTGDELGYVSVFLNFLN